MFNVDIWFVLIFLTLFIIISAPFIIGVSLVVLAIKRRKSKKLAKRLYIIGAMIILLYSLGILIYIVSADWRKDRETNRRREAYQTQQDQKRALEISNINYDVYKVSNTDYFDTDKGTMSQINNDGIITTKYSHNIYANGRSPIPKDPWSRFTIYQFKNGSSLNSITETNLSDENIACINDPTKCSGITESVGVFENFYTIKNGPSNFLYVNRDSSSTTIIHQFTVIEGDQTIRDEAIKCIKLLVKVDVNNLSFYTL